MLNISYVSIKTKGYQAILTCSQEHALKMSENLSSTKHAIGKLKGKPQTGRKYLHMKFLIKDCFQNVSRTSTAQQGDKISGK